MNSCLAQDKRCLQVWCKLVLYFLCNQTDTGGNRWRDNNFTNTKSSVAALLQLLDVSKVSAFVYLNFQCVLLVVTVDADQMGSACECVPRAQYKSWKLLEATNKCKAYFFLWLHWACEHMWDKTRECCRVFALWQSPGPVLALRPWCICSAHSAVEEWCLEAGPQRFKTKSFLPLRLSAVWHARQERADGKIQVT